MKFFDGMEAVVEEKGKNYLYIATRSSLLVDRLTMGFWPKPQYEQVGVYIGDTTGIEEGATIKVWFRKDEPFDWRKIKTYVKEFFNSTHGNVERVELVKYHEPVRQFDSFKRFFCSIKPNRA